MRVAMQLYNMALQHQPQITAVRPSCSLLAAMVVLNGYKKHFAARNGLR